LGCRHLRVFRSATTRQCESDQPWCLEGNELRKSLDHVLLPQSVELPERPRLAGCTINAYLSTILRNPIPIVVHIDIMVTNAFAGSVKYYIGALARIVVPLTINNLAAIWGNTKRGTICYPREREKSEVNVPVFTGFARLYPVRYPNTLNRVQLLSTRCDCGPRIQNGTVNAG
jgi:hypothetical protein